jgi:Domain of unknown function (DUF4169)
MPDPINLRQARKARARADKEAQAASNRAKFGRTKAERLKATATEALDRRYLDGHTLDTTASGGRLAAGVSPGETSGAKKE